MFPSTLNINCELGLDLININLLLNQISCLKLEISSLTQDEMEAFLCLRLNSRVGAGGGGRGGEGDEEGK